MQKIFITFTIFIFCNLSFSQHFKKIENIELLVYNTYVHKIINKDSISEEKIIVNQKTYDKNLLVNERIYDEATGSQLFYILFFYDSLKRNTSIEKYNLKNEPIMLKQIFYKNNFSDTSTIIFYENTNENVIPVRKKVFSYKKKLSSTKTFDLKSNKTIESQKFIYNKPNTDILNKIIIETKYPVKVKSEINFEYENNKCNKITFYNNVDKTSYVQYLNNNEKIVKEEFFENNSLKKIRIYDYLNDLELKSITEYDNHKKPQKFYSINYYFYKITFQNMKSYFDKK